MTSESAPAMAYREKLAWLSLGSQLLFYGAYFIANHDAQSLAVPELLRRLAWFAAATAGRGLVLGACVLWVMSRTPRADRDKPDERDRAIANRGYAAGYGVMIAGFILVGIIMPFSSSGWKIVNAALLAIVLSEMTRQVVAILSYRRGWHG